MNPDGFYSSRAAAAQNGGRVCWTCGRNNQQNEDLNRNFPFLYPIITERKFLVVILSHMIWAYPLVRPCSLA